MNTRSAVTPVTASDLFVLIEREFRRRKPRECSDCFVQLPYRVDPRHAGDANWEMVLPPECGNGCGLVVEEIVGEFQARYFLKLDEARPML